MKFNIILTKNTKLSRLAGAESKRGLPLSVSNIILNLKKYERADIVAKYFQFTYTYLKTKEGHPATQTLFRISKSKKSERTDTKAKYFQFMKDLMKA